MSSQEDIINVFMSSYGGISSTTNGGFTGVTLGVVVDTDDPLQMGRLKVFCPTLNDDPKQVQFVPWAIYGSPFTGSIDNSAYTRGTGVGTSVSSGPVQYGFWAIPDMGAHVLVTCVDGDYRRRIWTGCVPQHQETNALHHGRWLWEDGEVDGPLTSSGNPIQPLYENLHTAFSDKTDSPEWKTRAVEYQVSAIRDDANQTPNSKRKQVDQTYATIAKNEDEEWTKDALGSHGYDWSGFKKMGAYLASKTYGLSTPGMHSFVLDDRPFNNRVKIRTSTGHQVLLDDTNERIYISTNKGNNWVEMDSCGNIDVFSEMRISMHASKDINMTAGGTIRLHAGNSIHMFAGEYDENRSEESFLTSGPDVGEIRIQASTNLTTLAETIIQSSTGNTFTEVGVNDYKTVRDSAFLTVTKDLSVGVVEGDHLVSVAGDSHMTTEGNSKQFTKGTNSVGSVGSNEIISFTSGASVAAANGITVKSDTGNVDLHAKGTGGKVVTSSPDSQQVVGEGISATSTGAIASSASSVDFQVNSGGTPQGSAGMFGTTGPTNKLIIGAQDIIMDSQLGTIIQRTPTYFTSVDKLAKKINDNVLNLNSLTYNLELITAETKSAIGAAFTSPVTFNAICTQGNLWAAFPSAFNILYPTLLALNAELIFLGYAATDMQNVADLLNGNTSLLTALGLPTDLVLQDFTTSLCSVILEQLALSITANEPEQITPARLRELVEQIFINSGNYGLLPSLSTFPVGTPPPLLGDN